MADKKVAKSKSEKVVNNEQSEALAKQEGSRKRNPAKHKPHLKSPVIGEGGLLFKDDEEKKAYIQRTLAESMTFYKMPSVHSDEELIERIEFYFNRCIERGIKPTVEELCMSTGYVRGTIWDWETGNKKGFSPYTKDIIKKAKEFIANFDAKMVADGKMNPVAYIFRSKNYYGMKDQQEHIVTPNTNVVADPATLINAAKDLPDEE